MPNSARAFVDIWVGICCCHPPIPCIGMVGPIITASVDTKSGGSGQARLTDMTIGGCGHPGIIVSSSVNHKTNGGPEDLPLIKKAPETLVCSREASWYQDFFHHRALTCYNLPSQ